MGAKWFVSKNDLVSGPLSTEQVERQLEARALDQSDLIWGQELGDWQTIQTWKSHLPKFNAKVEPQAPSEQWHYAVNGQSFGPFARGHLIRELKSLSQIEQVMIWTKGMKEWAPLFEFHDLLTEVGVNRRQFPRAALTGQAVLKTDGMTLVAQLLSISEGGMAVQLDSALVAGQTVTIEIQSPSAFAETLHARAEVRYTANGILGLRFSNVPAESKAAIVQFVRGQARLVTKAA